MASYTAFILLFGNVYGNNLDDASFNEYDPYNADECQRIRRPWHELNAEERDLYISGLLELRKNGNGDINKDELISIGSVHEDTSAFMHQTSFYLFWHGYLIWELESRIRNLGGKWSCFGMPYWDFTLESGREDAPLILESGIGGDGDPDNYWTVNEYSWNPTIDEYWVPNNCVGTNDNYPLCSLKRALREDFNMPTAKEIGDTIINNPNFVDFAEYSHISAGAIHLLDQHPDDMDGFPQAYEPIWYLYHAAIQFHQALWTDCNEYDLINIYDLDNHPDAFTGFCNSFNPAFDRCDTDSYEPDSTWYKLHWGLDDVMAFGGTLKDKRWSYINANDLTVRKLYMIPKWNIIYDLGDGEGFYTDSGLSEYCKGKLNNHWFMFDRLEDKDEDEILSSFNVAEMAMYIRSSGNEWILCVFVMFSVGFGIYLYRKPSKGKIYNSNMDNVYGSV